MMADRGGIGVYVTIGGADVFAGRLYARRRRGVESASFVYDERYLSRADAYALDPELRLVTGSQHTPPGRAMFGAFSDCAPDRWGRTLVRRAERLRAQAAGTASRSLAEVDDLLGVRDDLRQGALRFRRDESGPFLVTEDTDVPRLADLPELLDLAAHAEDHSADLDELKRLVRVGSSLGALGRRCICWTPTAGSRSRSFRRPTPTPGT